MVQRRKNVIWLVADQFRAQATGYAGDPNVRTPHLDRLAAEGANFFRAVSGTPLCSPFRGAMMSGRYPHNNGVLGHRYPLPAGTKTVAHAFLEAGYRTCYVGKWHLDGDRQGLDDPDESSDRVRMVPPERRGGFEDWWAYENNNRPFDCIVHTDVGRTPEGIRVLGSADGMENFRAPGYETDGLTDILLAWLQVQSRERAEQPFFAVLSVQPPHNPYTAPSNVMARQVPAQIRLRPNVPNIPRITERARRDLAGYYAGVEQLDHNVGRIRSALEDLCLEDETYLMFFSDHGDCHGSHGHWRKTLPWEESIRIPFLVGGPSREHQNSNRPEVPINHVDIAPTSLGMCGIPVPAYMEGMDYSELIGGDPSGRGKRLKSQASEGGGSGDSELDRLPAASEVGETPASAWSEVIPDSAYLSLPVPTGNAQSVDRPWRGIVTTDNWKYVCLEGQPWMLYNLQEDPYELANLAHEPTYHVKRNELHRQLQQWIIRAGDAFDLPDISAV